LDSQDWILDFKRKSAIENPKFVGFCLKPKRGMSGHGLNRQTFGELAWEKRSEKKFGET
jgi:hypothetical protein